jgi:hypothetical protein
MNVFDALKAAVAEGRAVVCVFAVNGRNGSDDMDSGAIVIGRATREDLAALMAGMVVKATEAPKMLADMMGGDEGERLLKQVCKMIGSPDLWGGQFSGRVTRRETNDHA